MIIIALTPEPTGWWASSGTIVTIISLDGDGLADDEACRK
jgi:hypothetical protein